MRFSWIKISFRAVVLVIIYFLLTIYDSKFQRPVEAPIAIEFLVPFNDKLITEHFASIGESTEDERTRQYDSLVLLIATKLNTLETEFIESNNPIIDSLSYQLGLASALASRSGVDPSILLKSLWLWRQYIKEQSFFWNTDQNENKSRIASSINFIDQCEDFIVTNRSLNYAINSKAEIQIYKGYSGSDFKSGDILLSSHDTSYPYMGLAKSTPELISSAGLILVKSDSILYLSATPSYGLEARPLHEIFNASNARLLHIRIRSDHPEIISNPELPMQAASFADNLIHVHDVDYDFMFNSTNYSALSEAELLNYTFDRQELNISMPFNAVNTGYAYALSKLGIVNENQTTASEIQFYPSLSVIGLQISGENIRLRNIEMAAAFAGFTNIDEKIMKSLKWRLPYYRILKGYSNITSLFGNKPLMPVGMAPEIVLLHEYIDSQKEEIMPILTKEAEQFTQANDYFPTYSMLCKMAKTILAEQLHK